MDIFISSFVSTIIKGEGMSHGNIQDHVKTYRNVFFGLLFLTVITVAVSYIHFDMIWLGIFVGLLVASIKGYLVAANFMHLNDEKKMIHQILILSIPFLILLFAIPILWEADLVISESSQLWDDLGEKKIDKGHH